MVLALDDEEMRESVSGGCFASVDGWEEVEALAVGREAPVEVELAWSSSEARLKVGA